MWRLFLLCVLSAAVAQNGYGRDNPSNPLNYNPFGQQGYDENEITGDEIPGEAGVDYPVYDRPPRTSFRCSQQEYPGYYADPEAQCQAYYVCQRGGRGLAVLCPNGTVFNQETLVCEWWYNVDCGRAREFYGINGQIARAMMEATGNRNGNGYQYNRPSRPFSNGNGNGNGAFRRPTTNGYRNPDRTYLPPIVVPDRTYLPPTNGFNGNRMGPPDRTYLPPSNPDRTYLPPANSFNGNVSPDRTYLPPSNPDRTYLPPSVFRNNLPQRFIGSISMPERMYLPPVF